MPLVVFAGAEYGNGSSRDWAAKGTRLLGVRAVICQSFERIHRSNLVGMGVLPLTFEDGTSLAVARPEGRRDRSRSAACRATSSRARRCRPRSSSSDGALKRVPLLCRIDTLDELEYFRNGGILQYVLRQARGLIEGMIRRFALGSIRERVTISEPDHAQVERGSPRIDWRMNGTRPTGWAALEFC